MKARVAALLLAALALTGCSTGTDAVVRGTSFEFVSPGGQTDIFYDVANRQQLPAMAGPDLMTEGKQTAVADFPGKVMVLNLWGSWCPPCRKEAPEMQKAQDQVPGVQVLGINVREDNKAAPQDFIRDRPQLTYPSIYDPAGRTLVQLKGYPRNVVPSTIVLDKQHRVAAVFLRELLAEDLVPTVRRLTAE